MSPAATTTISTPLSGSAHERAFRSRRLHRIGDLEQVIRALLTIVQTVAVPPMIFDVIRAISASTGDYAAAGKARTGVLIAVAAAAFASSWITWVNWFITISKLL